MQPDKPRSPVVFVADAGRVLGGGHLSRCMALAETLRERGCETVFVASAGAARHVPALAALGDAWMKIDIDPAAPEVLSGALARAFPAGIVLLVVDHPHLGVVFEKAARAIARRIAVFDDAAAREHDCDLLIDLAPGRTGSDYRPWVTAHCRFILGPRYAPLRPAFHSLRAASLARRGNGTLTRVMVGFGATDPNDATTMALDGIELSGLPLAVDVVLGGADGAASARIAARVKSHGPRWQLHRNTQDVAAILRAADLAIGGAGTMAWERCALGVPSLIIVQADNQRRNADALAEKGAALVLGDHGSASASAIGDALSTLAGTPLALAAMSAAAARMTDGGGAARLAAELKNNRVAAAVTHHGVGA